MSSSGNNQTDEKVNMDKLVLDGKDSGNTGSSYDGKKKKATKVIQLMRMARSKKCML